MPDGHAGGEHGAGRFTSARLDEVLRTTCAALGLDARGARLLRFTNNAVYALAGDPVVVRILGSRTMRHRAERVVAVARHLAEHGVPAVRLLTGRHAAAAREQPLDVGGYAVTVWERVPDTGRRATSAQLADLLRRLHGLEAPQAAGRWNPLATVRSRVAEAEDLAAEDRAFLLERCASLEAQLAEVEYVLPPALVHGDAHAGNVIVGPDGPVLCDFDSSCQGPPEWDLVPVAVGVERFGDPVHLHRDLAKRYGFDVTSWSGFGVLRAARELKLTTSVLPILRSQPSVRDELHRRLADLRARRKGTRWSRYR